MGRKNNINLKGIPARFKSIIKKTIKLLLTESKDTRGIFLIGSIADDTYKKSSDIDMVWIKSHKIGYKRWNKIEEKFNSNKGQKIQLVPFSSKQIRWHFNSSSTMAHSIQQGILLYGKRNKLISELLKRKLSLPTKEWMKYWFKHWLKKHQWAKDSIKREKKYHKKYCKRKCHCTVFDDIARVTVNFAILYLETEKIIPVSKRQIIRNIKKPTVDLGKDVLEGMRLALKFSGKDKYLTLTQADKISLTATWLKKNLNRKLNKIKIDDKFYP